MIGLNVDRWHEVFETLRRNKLRTALTALGVFWGVFMLVVMLGFGRGLETGATGDLSHWAKNALAFWPAPTSLPYAGHKPGRRIRLSFADLDLIRQHIPGIRAVAPRMHGGWGSTNIVSRGTKSEAFQVSGDVPEFTSLEPVNVYKGRFLNPDDLREFRKVAVIGQNVKNALFSDEEDAIGKQVRIKNVPFLVVGVFRSEAAGEHSEWFDNRVFTPMTTFARMNGKAGKVDQFTILLADGVNSEKAEAEVRTLLKRFHEIDPEDPGGIDCFNREKEFRKFMGLFEGIAALSWVVGVLTLLAGVIGVSNILMISVAERTKEIGIRKAIGATPRSILLQIIEEAVLLTGLSGGLGLVAGVGVLALTATIMQAMPHAKGPSFFATPDLDLGRALFATLVLTVGGGLAGIAPARTALAIKPIEALAHE